MKFILITIGLFVVLRWVFRLLFKVFMVKLANDLSQQAGGRARTGGFGPFTYTTFSQGLGGQNPYGGAQQPRQEEEPKSNKGKKSAADPDVLGGDYIDFKEIK